MHSGKTRVQGSAGPIQSGKNSRFERSPVRMTHRLSRDLVPRNFAFARVCSATALSDINDADTRHEPSAGQLRLRSRPASSRQPCRGSPRAAIADTGMSDVYTRLRYQA